MWLCGNGSERVRRLGADGAAAACAALGPTGTLLPGKSHSQYPNRLYTLSTQYLWVLVEVLRDVLHALSSQFKRSIPLESLPPLLMS